MPQQAWIDFQQQQQEGHLISAVLMLCPLHSRRLRRMLTQPIGQERPEKPFVPKARPVTECARWLSHRSFRLHADKEVGLAGLQAPKEGL